ncbi:MAG: FliM/FliN family flagellar motor switch protein [Planctomycetes bacterium]|nr:FliM/FliN family flagellar motor switch protein [Planctomycetota bacterium]
MTPVAFDFRKPPPGELGRQANRWLTSACRRAADPWSRLLPYATALAVGNVEVVGAAAGLAALPDDAYAIPLTIEGEEGTALLIFRRPFLLALLAGLVGETPAALPADRDPTELEASLVSYLVRELFLDPVEKAWPTPKPLRMTPGGLAVPRLAWTGGSADLVLFATLDTTTPFGEHPVYLIVSRDGLGAQLAAADVRPEPPPPPAPSAHIEALVREMAVELTVLLGTADLTMYELSTLRTGDVVVLRQKVDQPLDGLLAGARKFRVWPGVVGERAAVVIDAPADEG